MRKPVENQHDSEILWPDLRWLDSEQIHWALRESHEDSRRMNLQHPPLWEALTDQELTAYHRQLFLWRLLRVNITRHPNFSILKESKE